MLKQWFAACSCLILLTAAGRAEDADELSLTQYGLSWGFTRTYWSADGNDEGYARAGNGAHRIGFRRVRQMSARTRAVLHSDYLWMRSTITTLICDTCYGQTITARSYFREIDLGVDFHYYPLTNSRSFYIGAGPMVRWGSAGIRAVREKRPVQAMKAAWFGVNILGGLRAYQSEGMGAFIEPVFTWSPDEADRWQEVFPPDNISVQMGLLW